MLDLLGQGYCTCKHRTENEWYLKLVLHQSDTFDCSIIHCHVMSCEYWAAESAYPVGGLPHELLATC